MNEPSGERSADLDLGYIDLNTATEDELAQIPWIGGRAARILVQERPFENMDDVRRVPGITEDIVDQLVRGGVQVGRPPEQSKAA
jgi:DNA uptake protein ComE-like DNA-binding protein